MNLSGTSPSRNKRGSSRRKGDEFQDFSALRLVLELYADGEDFQVYLEYEKTEAIDDIVIFSGKRIRAVQAKYAIDPLAVYVPDDFTDENSPAYFGKYAEGWRQAQVAHPGFDISVELLSNRSRDSALARVIGPEGNFTPGFIDGSLRKEAKTFRDKLKKACGFAGADADKHFQEFLRAFQFSLGQRRLDDLRGYLQGEVLDHELGISDRTVFLDLKVLVERHAIDLHEPITRSHLDEVFRKAQRRFLLPQIFPVDQAHFVRVETFEDVLRKEIENTSGGYIVVTGLPGSGKSTSLTEFFDGLAKDNRFAICRYYCFVRLDDDNSRLRIQAEALRVNLLSELYRQFESLLDRQFDYSEHRFAEALATIGNAVSAQGKKLIILLDGLDHAERDTELRDTVLRALPTALPAGIAVVVGTQELKHWQPFALREGRQQHHVPIPPFTISETRAYLVEKHGIHLDKPTIEQIHYKSQGLPLYLRYVAAWLREHHGESTTLQSMPEAGDGDIRNYYERLWANFERDGMAYGRYLCGVMAGLRFPVRADELAGFQTAISQVELEAALRSITHLLREEHGQASIFHDSFRVFVNGKLDPATRRAIARDILAKLKAERGSPRWFAYAFRYAIEASDEDYLLAEVNRPFVDYALQHCRPAADIMAAIEAAAKAAAHREDLVASARLGSLHFRTHERLEQFNYDSLAKVQLTLGRVGDVLGFCCRPQDQRWFVEPRVAEQVMVWCAETKHRELGEQLYRVFIDTQEAAPSAAVLGIYAARPARVLQWLSGFDHKRDMLERIDRFLPGYSPPLEAFLSSRFRFGPPDDWKRFKRIRRLFPNHLVRHILLRLVAKYRPKCELALELEDFLANTPIGTNLEIAGYGALVGLPAARVRELAGPVILPPREHPHHKPFEETEGHFDRFEWTAVVLGYKNDPIQIGNVVTHLGRAKTMYAGFLRFLLQAGLCIGRAAAGALSHNEGYSSAVSALGELVDAGREDQTDEMETLRACRPMLPELLFRLTEYVASQHPEKLDSWCDTLLALRDCEMWTSHWGISETTEDYTFELRIWERILAVPGMRSRLLPILRSCAKTYEEATALKSGSRSEHFLRLAAIAGNCGWRTEAERWREKGTACSLTYGYHKDSTIDNLVDVLELINAHEPEHGLARSAKILEIAKWMQAATDNRGTKYFEQSVFRIVLQTSREAAFQLVRFFLDHTGRWKMLDCLEQYCLAVEEGDTHTLWTLKDAFSPHFHESGRHSKQVARTAKALREFGQRNEPTAAEEWTHKYSAFIRSFIDPAWWPDDIWNDVNAAESRTRPQTRDPYSPTRSSHEKEFTIDGAPTARTKIEELLTESLDLFSRTVEKLRAENSYFHDQALIDTTLEAHSTNATSPESILSVWEAAKATGNDVGAKSLHLISQRLFDLGESDQGFECLLLAYQQSSKYYYGTHQGQDYLIELCQRDRKKVEAFLAQRCERALDADYGGFDLPRMIARFYSAVGDTGRLRNVFDDYLTHCDELFAHLPKDDQYTWLHDYREDGRPEEAEIVGFLIDLIAEPEIEQAKRLVRVLADLAKVHPELVCRIACERMAKGEPLLRERLEFLIESLATTCPAALALHFELVIPLCKEQNFRLRMSLIRIVSAMGAGGHATAAASAAAEEAMRSYSPLIAYPSRRFIHSQPSPEFVRFLRRAVLFDLHSRIIATCELLKLSPGVLLSYFEQALRASDWSEEEETERLKDDWRYHARDNRVVWITPRFHSRVADLLQEFVHQAVENGRYDANTIKALENVLRAGDPAFIATLPSGKPHDIPALDVSDGTPWVEGPHTPPCKGIEEISADGWTTVHEERLQSQTDGHHPVFVSIVRVRSILISPALATQLDSLPPFERWSDEIPALHTEERLTLTESQRRLREASPIDFDNELLPLVSAHDNGITFQGFRLLAFLHPTWLKAYDLNFDGKEVVMNGSAIARLEEWQEGYEDEPYSRDLLSAGMRLIVRNSWLKTILRDRDRALVIHTEEVRRWFKDFWKKEPTAESTRAFDTCFVHTP